MSGLDQWDWKKLPDTELQYLTEDQRVAYRMGGRCKQAIDEVRRDYQTDLDLSLGSIDNLDRILTILGTPKPVGCLTLFAPRRPTEADHIAQSGDWGAYLGELIRLHTGGRWIAELSKRPGESGNYLLVSDLEIDPVDAVVKHLADPSRDNIRNYFYSLIERVR